MKKLAIAFVVALIATVVLAVPSLAYYEPDQGASADVDCGGGEEGNISVSDSEPVVGTVVIFCGTVHVEAYSYNNRDYGDGYCCYRYYETGAYAKVDGSAYYVVYDPYGNPVAYGNDSWSDSEVGDTGYYYWPSDEDVSAGFNEDWYWETYVNIDEVGDYTAEQGGEASAEYGMWVQWYNWGWNGHCMGWVPDGGPDYYTEGDPAYDSCFARKTVTSRAAVIASTGYSRPYLVIELPDDSRHFFSYDGWGDPTSDDIVYTDGTWQVEISNGTSVQMDGSWHKTTYIDVDNQGNVTGKYGAGGSIVAEEIGLSQPITITKVG